MKDTREKNEKFTPEEWAHCIKVLSILKDDPLNNPDNQLFSTLITKIHKNAKKNLRSQSFNSKKANDLQTVLQTTLTQMAREGKTMYSDLDKKEKIVFTPLELPKNCYCCQNSYQMAHPFYNRLCPRCAVENYDKRFQNIDLENRKIILTGGRVKVGYATALRLLRNKAEVVVTTRFPALAWEQFQKENDFNEWKDRLTLYGLDLRNLQAINDFINFYKSQHDSLDILINNAAQTIKYPNDYYLPLAEKEKQLLNTHNPHRRLFPNTTPLSQGIKTLEYHPQESTTIALSRFGQPVDTREKTSWNATLEEISLHELVEVNLINQMAPYYLIKELKPLFLNSRFKEKFIINVSSSEGIFSYTNKTIYHPHTNMTKAALNMLTLTSGKALARESIYMSAVDVGWISTGARESLRQKQFEKGYVPPLDTVDGASRILDPILRGIQGHPLYGVLLKNYKVAPW